MSYHLPEAQIKNALYAYTKQTVYTICDFYYHSGDGIYAVCKNTGFVVCPVGMTRSKAYRTPCGYLIWKMDLPNNRSGQCKIRTAISIRDRVRRTMQPQDSYEEDYGSVA